jgi:hypothetical protein
MSAELWRLFDWFKDNADKSQTKLAINSNLGGKPELIDRLIEAKHICLVWISILVWKQQDTVQSIFVMD